MPVRRGKATYNDEFLIDGVEDGEAQLDGEKVPIFNALVRLVPSRLKSYGLSVTEESTDLLALLETLNTQVIPHADWRQLVHLSGYPIAVAVDPSSHGEAVLASLSGYGDWVCLDEDGD